MMTWEIVLITISITRKDVKALNLDTTTIWAVRRTLQERVEIIVPIHDEEGHYTGDGPKRIFSQQTYILLGVEILQSRRIVQNLHTALRK